MRRSIWISLLIGAGLLALALVPDLAFASPAEAAHGADPAAHGGADPHAGGHGGFADIEWVTPIIMNKGKTGLLWILINFAALFFLLDRLLFRGLRRRTAERHDQIKAELDKATSARKEAEGIIREYRQRMEKLEDDAAQLMAEAKQRAESDRKGIIAAAEEEAERIKAAATAAAEREAESRRRTLENEIVDRAIDRAEALVRQKLGAADHKRMVDDYVTQIGTVEFGAPGGGA